MTPLNSWSSAAGPAATPPRFWPPISASASRSSIPKPNPGGVCVYRGCIPSKALLHVAKVIDESRHATAWGVEFGEPKIDLDKLREFKNAVVKRLTERHRAARQAPQGAATSRAWPRSSIRTP